MNDLLKLGIVGHGGYSVSVAVDITDGTFG